MYCYVFLIAVTTKKRLCTVPFAPWTRSRPGVSRSMRRREPRKPPCSRKRSISSWILLKWKPLMIRKEQNLCFDMLRCFQFFLPVFVSKCFFSLTWIISECKLVFWNCAIFDVVLRHKMQTSRPHCRDWQRIPCSKHATWKRRLHTQEAPKPNPPQPWMWTPDPTKFLTYFRNLANIMIPGRDRSEGHPALKNIFIKQRDPDDSICSSALLEKIFACPAVSEQNPVTQH